MDNYSSADQNFDNLKEKLFGGMKNDPKVRQEFLDNLKKIFERAELEQIKLEEEKKSIEKALPFKIVTEPSYDPLSQMPWQIEQAIIRKNIGKKYDFSKTLEYPKFNRIDFSDWKYCVNLLINFCNSYSISKSEEQEKYEILNSRNFKNVLQSLNIISITNKTFVEIINNNKPLISIGMNKASFFRKNLLFMILYIQYINSDSKRKNLDTNLLATHWLKALINYDLFSNFGACIYLNANYKKEIGANKLASIKYFNNVILGEVEEVLKINSLKNDWISSIRITYSKLFGNEYKNCDAVKKIDFQYFSREELQMFIYILQYNISISESFPHAFETLIDQLLINEGISTEILESSLNELRLLNGPKFNS